MKNIKLFLVLVAILVSSFVGAAENLPFGEISIRDYAVTNTVVAAIQAVQLNPEDTSQEIVFMGSALGIKFGSYSEMLNYVRGKLRIAEGRFKEPKLLTNESMIVNVDMGTGGLGGQGLFLFNDLRHIDLVRGNDGVWRFPPGFIDTYEPNIARYMPILTKKAAKRAKIKVFSQGHIESDTDSEFPPIGRLPDAYIDGSGNLYVLDKYVVNDPTKEVYLTVEFVDGTVKRWGGDGQEIVLTTPKLAMEILDGELQLVLRGGNISDSLKIRGSVDGKVWTTVVDSIVSDKEMRFTVSPGTNSQALYQIGE